MRTTDRPMLDELARQTLAFIRSPYCYSPKVDIGRRHAMASRLAKAGYVTADERTVTLTLAGMVFCGVDPDALDAARRERREWEERINAPWRSPTLSPTK